MIFVDVIFEKLWILTKFSKLFSNMVYTAYLKKISERATGPLSVWWLVGGGGGICNPKNPRKPPFSQSYLDPTYIVCIGLILFTFVNNIGSLFTNVG